MYDTYIIIVIITVILYESQNLYFVDSETMWRHHGLEQIFGEDWLMEGGGELGQLIILREIMFRPMRLENTEFMPKPCDYFDITGGVGTGGYVITTTKLAIQLQYIRVIALMLGRLCMPIELAIEKYVNFSQNIYSGVKKWRKEKFKASAFESGMRGILESAGFPEDVLMQEDGSSCKSFVVALPSVNMTSQIFRTYKVKANQGYDCTVVQAARATTAAPELFKPVSITSSGLSETFVGAGLGHSNPTSLVLEEAVMVFGLSQTVACLVNIGAGHPGHVSWNSSKFFRQKLVDLLNQIATNCETLIENQCCTRMPGVFYRLNVDQGLQKMGLDDWNRQGKIQTHSLAYLQKFKVAQELNSLVNTLHDCPQKATLGMLNGHIPSEPTPSNISVQALFSIVPAPSSLFTGRTHFVLYGLGGAGKTQIALQFCHKFKSRYEKAALLLLLLSNFIE
ncbi:hypothetical protein C0995_007390 [Termitomyces sp. Mi166|nr:hypothetical protein C0995_007390 [Termitomyces sp. Mi166\